MLTFKLILLCIIPVLTTGFTRGQWQLPAYYYSRIPNLTPVYYGSASALTPTYLQPDGSSSDCSKGKTHKDVTFQSGTNSVGTVSSTPAQNSNLNNHRSISVPIPGFGHFQSSNSYPHNKNSQAQNRQSSTNNVENSFNHQDKIIFKSDRQTAETSHNKNHNHDETHKDESESDIVVHNNFNITASTLYQLPGMEHLKNCVPIPGTDGACFILQDDTNSDTHSESETTTQKPLPPSKQLIYVPPKTPLPRLDLKALNGNQKLPGSNYYDPQFNLRNQFLSMNSNQNNRFRHGTKVNNNNNNQFSGQTASSEILPTPQVLHSNANGNVGGGGHDKHSEGSEKVPGAKVKPPSDNVLASQEFYMQFLKLWSLYHKRYGCSFRPTAPKPNVSSSNYKRSVKQKKKKNTIKKTV